MGIVENTYAELKQQELKNNPYSCLHMADIDINPHQVEAFTFALSSLELGGAILADEVGLGKTIEAGLVIKYLLCSGKNKILLIMPSNLRKQWQVELEEKFDIDSLIVDSSNWEDYLARVKSKQAVIIVSYHFASKRKTEFGKIAWDFCVFDEAHRLRNVYKNGSKMANSLYELTKEVPKILLTATPIPIKNINALVTHNTAVLGILGVGKSCLTFELIKKIVAAGIKVICLDITNQYASDNGLYKYIPEAQIVSDLLQEKIDELESQSMRTGTSDSKSSWGNVENFKKLMESAVSGFMDANNKSVMVLNPEKYIVRQAATDFRITELKDVSLVEKVQIISEIVLKKCMDLGQIDKARCCVVYEEAHSLTPEFNSVVVKDDNSHANGTAKVILQGRKYGLGCIIVTQRTANVTKSILNQCNTIFALRVFDDTGKSFLENYIGKDYSDTLPTLEERHAIAIGKGIGLKQPVILQLNDMKYLQTNDGEKIVEKNECVDVETEEITPNL